MKKKSQTDRILAYLLKGNSITALSALTKFGCMRLASRISEIRGTKDPKSVIRARGGWMEYNYYKVKDAWIIGKNGKRYKKYWLA